MKLGASAEHRLLINSCLNNGVPFFWKGSGTLLIASSGIQQVLRDVIAKGFDVVGLEGFEIANPQIHPRLDVIFDAARRPTLDPFSFVEGSAGDLWFDVTLHNEGRSSG